MKQELNLSEAKAVFFAQYWGQKVLKFNDDDKTFFLNHPRGTHDSYLLLKPLRSISDEDAIEMAKIAHPTSFANSISKWGVALDTEYGFKTVSAKNSYHSFDIDTIDGTVSMYDGDNPSNNTINHYGVLDFLRSKSYALPHYCPIHKRVITVEEQVELGWVKLID